ncbi:MAG: helix-turn-helix domain-containing protein [Chitinophagaceae bacterium]|nr:helix-turn-helix domain-containing protein [Chitinophagaceae bacterium]
MKANSAVPILIPFEPDEFWSQIRVIIREEVERNKTEQVFTQSQLETPGLTEKPLFKIDEVCSLFKVTKPTIYDWIKHGKLKRVKIRSRVYFLGSDIRQLMQA